MSPAGNAVLAMDPKGLGAELSPNFPGSTPVVCVKEGRACVGTEIEEKYCELAVERLRQGVLPFPAHGSRLTAHEQGEALGG